MVVLDEWHVEVLIEAGVADDLSEKVRREIGERLVAWADSLAQAPPHGAVIRIDIRQ